MNKILSAALIIISFIFNWIRMITIQRYLKIISISTMIAVVLLLASNWLQKIEGIVSNEPFGTIFMYPYVSDLFLSSILSLIILAIIFFPAYLKNTKPFLLVFLSTSLTISIVFPWIQVADVNIKMISFFSFLFCMYLYDNNCSKRVTRWVGLCFTACFTFVYFDLYRNDIIFLIKNYIYLLKMNAVYLNSIILFCTLISGLSSTHYFTQLRSKGTEEAGG